MPNDKALVDCVVYSHHWLPLVYVFIMNVRRCASVVKKGETMMRIAIGGLLHETSTFSRVPTTLGDFMRTHLEGEEMLERRASTKSALGGYIDAARDFGYEPRPFAYPGAPPPAL